MVVAGAGMAGLVAATRLRELGRRPLVLEKRREPGGSMRLSSGVVWRHRDFARFRRECPAGLPDLQQAVFERLDDDLGWLESIGAEPTRRDTGNPLTTGVRFDPAQLTSTLARAAGPIELGRPLTSLGEGTPVILATGGFQADPALVREHITPNAGHLLLRASPGSTGDGLRLGLEAGAELTAGLEEFYGRNMPAPPARVTPERFVECAQLYAHFAEVTNDRGERFQTKTWSEIDVVQWTARQPGARARYRLPEDALGERVGERSVAEMVRAAEQVGAPVRRHRGTLTVEVVAGITTTLGGLRVDRSAVAANGVLAAGADAGGIATGGYASGLAAALVFGKIAAESASELV